MSPGTGQAFFRIAVFITLASLAVLPFLTPGTAEFVVDVLALAVGLASVAVVAVLARWSARP
ncbi:MAG: hypothetical protein AUK03_03855 [Anaerolineae bacterium CG2_30_64_16]|nr:MAG: hypothetical protein AUK03_03855 [Anaerolineae bacterium CG2_30_64_16]